MEVLKFDVSIENGQPNLILTNTYYSNGELYKTITKDENWKSWDGKDKTAEEFTNKNGQVLLKRKYNNKEEHDTHYIYDDFGNLTYVLPPLASEKTKVYQVGEVTLPASAFVTGGSPSGSASLGIRQVSPGEFEFFADFNLNNLPSVKLILN